MWGTRIRFCDEGARMNGKSLYSSKTFWVNVLALVALVCQAAFGWVIEPEAQAGILAVINLILRLVTREPVTWWTGAAKVLVVAGLAGLVSGGCAGVQVCREAAIVVRDASAPERMTVSVECDGTSVVTIDTEEVVTPSGVRWRDGR